MGDYRRGDNQAGQGDAVADLLDQASGRAQRWRGHVRAAVVVQHDADDDVYGGYAGLADEQRRGVLARVTHFGRDGEEAGGSGVGEQDGRDGRDGLGEAGIADDLEVGDPGSVGCWG